MAVFYGSDWHVERMTNYKQLFVNLKQMTESDTLLLVGDIMSPVKEKFTYDMLDFFCEYPGNVLYCTGNHEYYGSEIDVIDAYFYEYEKINPKFHFMNNRKIVIDGVSFYGGCGWPSLALSKYANSIQNTVNDFNMIKDFSLNKMNDLHLEFKEFILNEEIDMNSVFMTHFLPSRQLIQDKFKGDFANDYFNAAWFDLYITLNPKFWVYGHNHNRDSVERIHHTDFITNQYGYYSNINFNSVLLKTIDF